MSAITDPPNDYTFGFEFNYAAWPKDSVVTLVNVPWNNDYRDIVKFADRSALNAYIDSIAGYGKILDNVSYIKANTPLRLPIPFNPAYKFNYLRVTNPLQPIENDELRDYYYFITGVNYLAPDTTEFILQLDVWQTFGFDVTFGNSYIERGHIGIANTHAFDSYGRDYLTIPEGFDIGNEYQVVKKSTERIMSLFQRTDDTFNFALLIVSTVRLTGVSFGTEDAPHLESAIGGKFQQLPSGAEFYVFASGDSFLNWLSTMADVPWITQGIVSISVIPDIRRYIPGFTYTDDEPTLATWSRMVPKKYALLNDWRNDADITAYIPVRYRILKKLFTYPYMAIELTTFTGTPIIIKPEAWNDANATVVERVGLTPPDQRITIHPHKYNAITGSTTDDYDPDNTSNAFQDGGDDNGEYIDFATQMSNFPTLAIVNNGAISYLAANAHGIAFQRQSADWSQQRALGSNQTTYDQASSGIHAANELNRINVNADRALTGLASQNNLRQTAIGGAGGIIGGGAGGATKGPAGALAGAASGLPSGATAMAQAATQSQYASDAFQTRAAAANAGNRASTNNQSFVRDTNKALSDWSAKGDYANDIAGINAKVQDANLIQPTTSGQVGGEAMNLVNNNMVVSARFKMIDQASIRAVGEYWLRYGYAVRKFAVLPASLMVMSKFTYWKISESYIASAPMPESFKQVIRGIFEKGVTVWASPAYIGVTDIADNTPLGGITL